MSCRINQPNEGIRTVPAPIEDRVTNLEALVAGIITQHGENQERADARHTSIMEEFGNVHAKLAEMDHRFDRVDAKLDNHEKRFDRIDAKFDQVDARFDAMDAKLAAILAKLDSR